MKSMKIKGVLLTIFILLLLSVSFVLALESNSTAETASEKVAEAYDCLKNEKVLGKCSSLSLEDQIFSLLAIGECKEEVMADSLSEECWPSERCTLKTTAQAILALDKTSVDTTDAENWLISQTTTPSDLIWYLQIDSEEETSCKITYRGMPYNIKIDEDKKINRDAGLCLDLSLGDFLLKIKPGCFDEDFEISCDKDFQTSLIFKIEDSETSYVSSQTSFSSASGKTTEKVKSSCFRGATRKCDYEGSLWAALILSLKGYDVEEYMPYLITMAEENQRHLPESFLYFLTGREEYKSALKLKQKANKYWDEGDKFYDTALALYPISTDEPEKINTKEWLLEIQLDNGCFPTTIKNNAFILASIWPEQSRETPPSITSCESAGYYCVSVCEGTTFSEYYCPSSLTVCCDTLPSPTTCEDQLGVICPSGQSCSGGIITSASDLSAGEICCIGGICKVPTTPTSDLTECKKNGGVCVSECTEDEVEVDYGCDSSSKVCCIKKTEKETSSYWWIWLLIILIILTVLGIIFRKKITPLFGKKPPRKPMPPYLRRPGTPRVPMMRRPVQRRIVAPLRKPMPRKPVKKTDELSKVLDKLKKI